MSATKREMDMVYKKMIKREENYEKYDVWHYGVYWIIMCLTMQCSNLTLKQSYKPFIILTLRGQINWIDFAKSLENLCNPFGKSYSL